jgi:hypothetical protein
MKEKLTDLPAIHIFEFSISKQHSAQVKLGGKMQYQ